MEFKIVHEYDCSVFDNRENAKLYLSKGGNRWRVMYDFSYRKMPALKFTSDELVKWAVKISKMKKDYDAIDQANQDIAEWVLQHRKDIES